MTNWSDLWQTKKKPFDAIVKTSAVPTPRKYFVINWADYCFDDYWTELKMQARKLATRKQAPSFLLLMIYDLHRSKLSLMFLVNESQNKIIA